MTNGVIDFNQHSMEPFIDLLCRILAEQPEADYAFVFQGKAFSYFTCQNDETDRYEAWLCEIDAMPEDKGGDPEMTQIIAVFYGDDDGFVLMGDPENEALLSAPGKVLRNGFLKHLMKEVAHG